MAKVKVVYSPEGAEPRSWEFDPEGCDIEEAELIEDASGVTYGEWADLLSRGSAKAIRSLVFACMRRDHPALEYAELKFNLSEFDVEQVAIPKARKKAASAQSD